MTHSLITFDQILDVNFMRWGCELRGGGEGGVWVFCLIFLLLYIVLERLRDEGGDVRRTVLSIKLV